MRGNVRRGIRRAVGKNSVRFCVPGHKAESGGFLHYDVTELEGTDNLQCPREMLLTSQKRAAELFGARRTFYSVNGSTAGNLAMITAACKRGGKLIVDRCCHSSVIHAIVLMGITPVFVEPVYLPEQGIYAGVRPYDIECALRRHPDADGVLVTSPTYYGICSDLWGIAEVTHHAGKVLLVDEAHGAHFCLSSKLPSTALASGADLCVQSAHKTLSSLTQTALLHVGSDRIAEQRVQEALLLYQTTSPSYLMLASLDDAVARLMTNGKKAMERTLKECERTAVYIERFTGIRVLGREEKKLFTMDPTRLVFRLGADAEEVQHTLQKEYGILTEMADGQNLVCVATMGNTSADYNELCRALERIGRNLNPMGQAGTPLPKAEPVMLPSDAYFAPIEEVAIPESVGRIAARPVTKTPPCIPLLIPGERIREEHIPLLDGERITVVKEEEDV